MKASSLRNDLAKHLKILYPDWDSSELISFIEAKISVLQKTFISNNTGDKWSEKDIALITYGDSIREKGRPPLDLLSDFIDRELKDTISIVHLLPFFPYSSDDGFSVIDYREVNPDLGGWEQVENIAKKYRLMADLVINHVSSKNSWFKAYCDGMAPFTEYFVEGDPKNDYSEVVRPRNHPLLTAYKTKFGTRHLWTTFSADQIDLNFQSPKLLQEMLDILFLYLEKRVQILRLDAIAFLWKKAGTSCIHLPQTHEMVKLIRTILNAASSNVILLTETNVPDKENLSYYGNHDEAHMVYQFTLPPLILHALYRGNAAFLTGYIETIQQPGADQTFLNFTASHDGIGVRPLEGITPPEEVTTLIEGMKQNGALVSEKLNSDGSLSPYEINITYFSACEKSCDGAEELQVERFLCSQTIMMSLQGIPAFYIHSLLACSNDIKRYKRTNQKRAVNRKKWDKKELEKSLNNRDSSTSIVLKELKRRIGIRRKEPLFSPGVGQKVFSFSNKLFVIKRFMGDNELVVVCNVYSSTVSLDLKELFDSGVNVTDLLSDGMYAADILYKLLPYQCCWFKRIDSGSCQE